MNKLLIAGLLSAVAVGAQAEATQCHPGGFYAGLNAGFTMHKSPLKVKEGNESDGTAAKLLTGIKAAKDGWEKNYNDAKQAKETATTESAKAAEAVKAPLTAAQKAYADVLIAQYTATAGADGELGVGDAAVPAGTTLANLRGFTQVLFADKTVKDVLANKGANPVVQTLATEIPAASVAAYNAAIKKVIPTYVAQLFDGKLPAETAAVLNVKEFVVGSVANHDKVVFAEATVKTNTAFQAAKKAADDAAAKLTAADATLKLAEEKVTKFKETLGTDKEVKYTDLASDATITAKVTAINKLEMNELLANANGKVSKSKGGFVAEAVVGFDHRIDDIMVGAELFVGFDTSKMILRDKKVTDARKAGTADKSLKDGIELKRQFYFGIAPRIGYMFTPELEGYIMVGAQLNRYSVDAKGLAIVFDHTTAILDQATKLNEAREKGIEAAEKAKDADAKKFYTDIPVISTEETFTARNAQYKKHSKTKFAPVVGLGIRYAFTPDVFGTFQYKYQFNTKVIDYNKTGDFQVKDQNHTVTVGVGFRF